MVQRRIIIDCDPGQDDAVNLLLAMASPDEFEILGITTVAGNVPLELTARNARIICELAGRPAISVFKGCDRPLARDLLTAERIHGKTGIDGMDITDPTHPLQPQHAVDWLVDTLLAAEP
ncbi:MAG: nucleoside hydrolase, partial [Pseudomonadota bacterium]